MLGQEIPTTASPVVRSDTLPRTACRGKEKEKEELEPTSLTSIRKRTLFMREAKPKEAG
jgi:hypothetical protein